MKTILLYMLYSLLVVLFLSCNTHIVNQEKTKKIVLRSFTGIGENDKTTNWFYIKNIADRGFGGYYFKSNLKVNDFKDAHFTYSKIRPLEFEGEYASGERIEFLDSADLPPDILKHLSDLESLYQKR